MNPTQTSTAESLCNAIRSVCESPERGAEVGVWEGWTSAWLLRHFPMLHLFMVDRWLLYNPGGTGKLSKIKTQDEMHAGMLRAVEQTHFAHNRRTVMIGDSIGVASTLKHSELDFVFIDGDHSYVGVCKDLKAWWPCLRDGGLYAGHDYGSTRFKGVGRAVKEFAAKKKLELGADRKNRLWWMVKPTR